MTLTATGVWVRMWRATWQLSSGGLVWRQLPTPRSVAIAAVREEDTACPACGAVFEGETLVDSVPLIPKPNATPLAITVLQFCAWLDLAVSAAVSIIFATAVASTGTNNPFNAVWAAVAVAIFLQGVIGCSLFLVVASIAENLVAIRNNTAPR